MKYLILLFFSFTYFTNAEDYIFESSANLKSENMMIADNFSVKNMSIEIRWTDSLGEYGKGRCIGLSTKKISEVSEAVRAAHMCNKPVVIDVDVDPKALYSFRIDSFKHREKK